MRGFRFKGTFKEISKSKREDDGRFYFELTFLASLLVAILPRFAARARLKETSSPTIPGSQKIISLGRTRWAATAAARV